MNLVLAEAAKNTKNVAEQPPKYLNDDKTNKIKGLHINR